MTAETDEHEFERRSNSNLSSCEDLPKVGGEFNGIVHDSADGDVMVKGADNVSDDPLEKDPHDTECVPDLTEAVGDVSELYEEKQIEDEELGIGKGACVQNGCIATESVVSSSNPDIAAQSLQGNSNGVQVIATEELYDIESLESEFELDYEAVVEEQNKLQSFAEVDKKLESQAVVREAVEYQVLQLHNEADVEEKNKLESSDEVDEKQESQVNQLRQLNNGEEKVEVIDGGEEKGEEPIALLLVAEVDESKESLITVVEAVEPELHKLRVGEEKVEEQESSADIEENQESKVTVTKAVESDLDQEKKEAAKMADEIPVEGPVRDLGTEMELKLTACPVKQLEMEAGNGSDSNTECLPICPVEGVVAESKVINDSAEGNQIMHTLDGSVRNADSLPCPVEDSKSEIEVGKVSIESLPIGPVDDKIIKSEVGNVSVLIGESYPTCAVDCMRSESVVRNLFIESSGSTPSCSIVDIKSEIKVGNGSVKGGENMANCVPDKVKSETDICNGSIEGDDIVPTCLDDIVKIESESTNRVVDSASNQPTCPVTNVEIESDGVIGSVESGNSLPTCPVSDVKFECEFGTISFASSRDVPTVDAAILESEVPNGSVENSERAVNCVNDVIVVENEGIQSNGGDVNPICQETDGIEGIQRDESSPSSSRDTSTVDGLTGQKVEAEVEKRLCFLIRNPRYVDDNFREQITLVQQQVDEKSQIRDAIKPTIQMRRTTCSQYRNNFEAAKSEERAARETLNAKRQEIDSVQSLIDRVKIATSIEDIDGKVLNMKHMIEHETLPLKEEKQLIREIKQLKHLREQLSSNMGRHDELQQALGQREIIEERFRVLKRELDHLKNEVLRAEGITKTAKKKYFDESEKIKELQAQFKAADDMRQEAYTHLQSLKKEFYEKNKYFWRYKDDLKAANDYASAGDREALQGLCVNQVETVMELWNKNDDFRNEYVRCNSVSTLKRLRTLDGRSLGPDEEPPVLRSVVEEKVGNAILTPVKINSVFPISTSEQEKTVLLMGPEKADSKSVVKVEQKTAKSKKPTNHTTLENGSAAFSGRKETEEEKEEHKRTMEEEELARKAKELQKEVDAAKLKEQLRLEERAKAREAEERKRRNAEKAQARAKLRAQKEAELKEKEREKRVRKKERKKASTAEARNGGNEIESAPSLEETAVETTQEPDNKEKPMTLVKRAQKPALSVKQTKITPLPLPLRNKGKRRMQPWMWVLLLALLILALFLVGNNSFLF